MLPTSNCECSSHNEHLPSRFLVRSLHYLPLPIVQQISDRPWLHNSFSPVVDNLKCKWANSQSRQEKKQLFSLSRVSIASSKIKNSLPASITTHQMILAYSKYLVNDRNVGVGLQSVGSRIKMKLYFQTGLCTQ